MPYILAQLLHLRVCTVPNLPNVANLQETWCYFEVQVGKQYFSLLRTPATPTSKILRRCIVLPTKEGHMHSRIFRHVDSYTFPCHNVGVFLSSMPLSHEF